MTDVDSDSRIDPQFLSDLRARYQSVLDEPLPEDIRILIMQLDRTLAKDSGVTSDPLQEAGCGTTAQVEVGSA